MSRLQCFEVRLSLVIGYMVACSLHAPASSFKLVLACLNYLEEPFSGLFSSLEASAYLSSDETSLKKPSSADAIIYF